MLRAAGRSRGRGSPGELTGRVDLNAVLVVLSIVERHSNDALVDRAHASVLIGRGGRYARSDVMICPSRRTAAFFIPV
jgi:hypothetical protein